nr:MULTISPECIES: hypothetical protein [Nocardia]
MLDQIGIGFNELIAENTLVTRKKLAYAPARLRPITVEDVSMHLAVTTVDPFQLV